MDTSTVHRFGSSPVAALVVLAAALAFAPHADAASAPPIPAIQQYVEQLPTSGGSVVAGSRGTRKLPSALVHEIDTQGGSDAPVLKAAASSAGYGAPAASTARAANASKPNGTAPKRHTTTAPAVPSGGAVSAAAGTVTGSDSHALAFVVAAALATTLIGAFVAFRRRRT